MFGRRSPDRSIKEPITGGNGRGGEDRWGRERRQRDHLLRNIAAGSGSEKAEERGREEKTEEGRGSLWERSRHVSDGG